MWTHSSRCPGPQPEPCPTCRPSCPQGPKGSQGSPELPSTYCDLSEPLPGLQLSHQKTTQPETKGQVKTKGGVFPQEPGHRPGQTSRQAASCSAHSAELGSVPCPTCPRPQAQTGLSLTDQAIPARPTVTAKLERAPRGPSSCCPASRKPEALPCPKQGVPLGVAESPLAGPLSPHQHGHKPVGRGPSTAGVTPAGRVGLER